MDAAGQPEDSRSYSRAAALALLLVNLIPLVGVLRWGWTVFDIVFLYWCETVVIGCINVLKMLFATPDADGTLTMPVNGRQMNIPALQQAGSTAVLFMAIKLFLIPFFIIHYGMFCAGHFMFILAIFTADNFGNHTITALENIVSSSLLIAIAALVISHLYSFLTNYLGNGEYRRTNPLLLMMTPYRRIIVMHLTILGGGALTMIYGSPVPLLCLLVLLKTGMDLRAHTREHRRFGTAAAEADDNPAAISNLA